MIEKMNAKALARLREEEAERASWLPLKELAIRMYSDCRGVCRGCGEWHVEELAVLAEDEYRNGYTVLCGGYDRMLTAKRPLYKWLKMRGYPPGFMVICVQCFKDLVRIHAKV